MDIVREATKRNTFCLFVPNSDTNPDCDDDGVRLLCFDCDDDDDDDDDCDDCDDDGVRLLWDNLAFSVAQSPQGRRFCQQEERYQPHHLYQHTENRKQKIPPKEQSPQGRRFCQ